MKVIINADDFGKSPKRNRAIIEAFTNGMITSAGLIVTGDYLQDAIDLLFKQGEYVNKIHLHFNLAANQLQKNPMIHLLRNPCDKMLFSVKMAFS